MKQFLNTSAPNPNPVRTSWAVRPGKSGQKVVLALRLLADDAIDDSVLLRRLVAADPSATGYLTDLSPASDYAGSVLVGISPELRGPDRDRGHRQPFAGSAARSEDPDTDAANGQALRESGKNRHEHQLVVDTMRERRWNHSAPNSISRPSPG